MTLFSSVENTPETGSDYNLAVKMMFNYGLDSNATTIFEGMKKETVPARVTDEGLERDYLQHGYVQTPTPWYKYHFSYL